MSINKTEYRIEVWQDEWNGSVWTETKVVTIGANDMDFLGKARNPILKIDVNGEVTFSFDMNTRYFDYITGKKEDNYLLPYLFNEAKIKVYCPEYDDGINGGWFDFIIKEIKEKRGTNISYSYVCQYLPINELSKTGQNLVFSLDLENGTGKIDELEQKVIDGTDWILGDIAADLTEATEETLFKVTTTQLLNLTGMPTMAGKPDDITNLPIGTILYVPYSEILATTSSTIQVIYVTEDLILANGNIISNKKCNYTIDRTSFGTPTYTATSYRGYRIVLTYQTEYKNVSNDAAAPDYRYVTVYSKAGSSTVYYGYTNTEVISNDPLSDIVVGTVQHYFYYDGTTIVNADNETGLTPVLIANSQKYRTLEASQSNRFNLTQSIAELFEVWARFDIYHDATGAITSKRISFVDTIGSQNWAGFTYGVNLTGITRNVVSTNLSTKMFVPAIENENLSTGSCSIAYAKGNTAKEEFLINLDYYTQVGLLDNEVLTYDLYDVNGSTGIGYLTKLGNLNIQYDNYSNTAVSLETYISQYTELVAAMNDAITAAQQEVTNILTAWNNGVCSTDAQTNYNTNYANAVALVNTNTTKRDNYQAQLDYYKNQKAQVDADKASILAQKKALNEIFNTKYSRYIQEGTWTGESTYVDNDLYYYDAQNVLLESSRPSIEYTINVVDISILTGYEDYSYKIGDITYIEDVEYFGYTAPDIHGNSIPYREQVIISSIECNLDNPTSNKITVQNYKNQFDSLFQRVTATVQTYQLNEQIYQRANNFTTDGQITFDSLQSSLINNSLILSRSLTEDVIIDKTGITLTDQENALKMVRIVSGGVFLSSDGGVSWKSGITGEGINTNLLTAGQIDVGKINIMSGAYPTFSWDSTGLYAYKYTGVPGSLTMDKTSYVRFNQDGIYGAKANTKMFSLDWDGLYLKTGNGQYDIQLGLHPVGATQYLFSAINNSTNTRTFSIDANGNAYFKGNIEATSGTLNSITANNFNLNTGTISGNVSFYGDISGASGTFTGALVNSSSIETLTINSGMMTMSFDGTDQGGIASNQGYGQFAGLHVFASRGYLQLGSTATNVRTLIRGSNVSIYANGATGQNNGRIDLYGQLFVNGSPIVATFG